MGAFWAETKRRWVGMLELPWASSPDPQTEVDVPSFDQSINWIVGWIWSLAGLALGALWAPLPVHLFGPSSSLVADVVLVGIAVFVAFFIQFIGWVITYYVFIGFLTLTAPFATASSLTGPKLLRRAKALFWWLLEYVLLFGLFIVIVIPPFVLVGYSVYRYFAWFGADQGAVTVAFVGALLVKAFVIPVILGACTSKAFQELSIRSGGWRRAASGMEKWEYASVEYDDSAGQWNLLEPPTMTPLGTSYLAAFNALGEQGWELVSLFVDERLGARDGESESRERGQHASRDWPVRYWAVLKRRKQ